MSASQSRDGRTPGRFRPVLLLLADDLAHRVHGLAHPAPKVALCFFGLALAFEVAVADHLAGLFLNRPGGLLKAAFYPLPVHRVAPFTYIINESPMKPVPA